jgi:hypothetical protein
VRRSVIAIPAVLAVLGSVLVATPAFADAPIAVSIDPLTTLTLPSTDAIRDSQTVTVHAASDIHLAVTVLDSTSAVVKTLTDDTALTSTGTDWVAQLALTDDGLVAGSYTVHVAGVSDDTAGDDVAFVVGSGMVKSVSIKPSKSALYPSATGSLTFTSVVITARDETGSVVPAHGTVKAASHGRTKSASFATSSATAARTTLSVAKLPLGTAKLSAKLVGATGSYATFTSGLIALRSTSIKSVSLSRSVTTVFPKRDGYRDTVTVSINSSTTTGKPVTTSGTAVIKRGTKTAATWKLSSGKTSITWNGLDHGRVVAGTYTLTVSLTGPDGPAKVTTTSISVSAKHLEGRSSAKWVSAKSLTSKYVALDLSDLGYCAVSGTAVKCSGYDDYYGDGYSLISFGSVSIPQAVRSATQYGKPTTRITADVTSVSGDVVWDYATSSHVSKLGTLSRGQHGLNWVSILPGEKAVSVAVGLGTYADSTIARFRIEYRWKVLVN